MRVRPVLRSIIVLLLASVAPGVAEVHHFTILHVNDLHARLLPDDRGRGGFAHVATAIERERQKAEHSVVLHAGDMVQGSPVSTIFQGSPAFEVGNGLGIDAHCLGNHEFDYGWERIADFERVSDAPILAANVLNQQGDLLLRPAMVLEAGDLDIAVIGAVTPRLLALIKADQAGPWRTAGLVESLRPVVEEMHERTDMVVVLGHLFDDEDELVLRELPDVDVVVSGHDHGGRQEPLLVDGRVGVKLRAYGVELGRLAIAFDTDTGRIVRHEWTRIPVSADRFPADPATAERVAHWESQVSKHVDVAIGYCERALDRSAVQALVERAIRDVTGADLAYMNRGGVRDSLGRGTVMARHVWNILPFDNMLVSATVLGRHLPEEATAGRRVDPNRIYRFVTNDYVAGQWRGRGIPFRSTEWVLRDTLLEWVKSRPSIP